MSEEQHQNNVKVLIDKIKNADAICVGAGAGMSASGGHRFWYERDEVFIKEFGDFEKRYGYHSALKAYHYFYSSPLDRWAFLATLDHLLYELPPTQPYFDLMELVKDKPYHIVTTNQDMQFSKVFEKEKITEIQGNHGYIQCITPCHDEIYENKEFVYKMYSNIHNLTVDREYIPKCPKCGKFMIPWIRCETFLEGSVYQEKQRKWKQFIEKYQDKKILFLELGVGQMTPMFIQHPFWEYAHSLPHAYYITINPRDAFVPEVLKEKGYSIKEDISEIFHDAVSLKRETNHQ